MDKINDYRICRGENEEVLQTSVRELLSQGWQPFGIMVSRDGSLLQPMIRFESESGREKMDMVPAKPTPKEEAM